MSKNKTDWQEEPTLMGIREVDYDPLQYVTDLGHVRKRRSWQGCLTVGVLLVFIVAGFAATLGLRDAIDDEADTAAVEYTVVPNENVALVPEGISPLFTAEIQFWEADILRWAQEYNLDPNLIATVMQIESCGDPEAGSTAGAQGLFQVMPFHFTEGEAMRDINNNAKRGLNYLSEGLRQAEGHVGLALAGYNGGHGMIAWGWARWPDETRRYHYWGTGIYYDALAGKTSSERLQEWLNAGGTYLCNQAAARQQTLTVQNSG